MSQLPDLDDIIRHTDSAYLDEHFAWNADPADIADQLHAALRAEVLNEQGPDCQETLEEAAQMYRNLRDAIVETMADPSQWDGDGDEGSILANYVRWLAAGKPDEDPEGFFQAEHTYRRGIYEFRCLTLTTDPRSGEARAVGLRSRGGWPWDGAALDPDDWEHGGWTDTTNTTTGDNT